MKEPNEYIEYVPHDDFFLAYSDVKDSQIQEFLDKKDFIDGSDEEHTKNTTEHHANQFVHQREHGFCDSSLS